MSISYLVWCQNTLDNTLDEKMPCYPENVEERDNTRRSDEERDNARNNQRMMRSCSPIAEEGVNKLTNNDVMGDNNLDDRIRLSKHQSRSKFNNAGTLLIDVPGDNAKNNLLERDNARIDEPGDNTGYDSSDE